MSFLCAGARDHRSGGGHHSHHMGATRPKTPSPVPPSSGSPLRQRQVPARIVLVNLIRATGDIERPPNPSRQEDQAHETSTPPRRHFRRHRLFRHKPGAISRPGRRSRSAMLCRRRQRQPRQGSRDCEMRSGLEEYRHVSPQSRLDLGQSRHLADASGRV